MKYLNLNNGTKIPAAGIGTFLMQPKKAEAAVTAALNRRTDRAWD
jgi:diketogulonate reductase-like aldo/keto reductase